MNSCNQNDLLLFLYGELTPKKTGILKKHLDKCEICKSELSALRETVNIYRQVPLEIPAQGILPDILPQKTEVAPRVSGIGTWLESLISWQPRNWVFATACGILLVVGFVYFANVFLPTKFPATEVDLAWNSNLKSSLEDISGRISQLQEGTSVLHSTVPENAEMFASLKTIEAELSALNKQITDFSNSLSYETF